MRSIFTLLAGATILFTSCSSSHKAQSSDDPGYASTKAGASSGGQSDYYNTAPSDQYVQMKTTDQARWSTFDDYNDYDSYYASSPIGFGASYGYGYPAYGIGYPGFGYYGYPGMSIGMGFWDPYFGWNNYFMWNSYYNPYFYNPYYGGGVLYGKSYGVAPASVYNNVRGFNPSVYHANGVFVGNNNRFYRPGAVNTSNSPYNSGTAGRFNNSGFTRSGSSPRSFGGFGESRGFSPSSGGGFRGGGGFRH
jgi:hypothetical protein